MLTGDVNHLCGRVFLDLVWKFVSWMFHFDDWVGFDHHSLDCVSFLCGSEVGMANGCSCGGAGVHEGNAKGIEMSCRAGGDLRGS